MKKLLFTVAFLPAIIWAQSSDVNVLSYYAVDNSMDGQPVIEEVNVLRFFPVFAIGDSIQSVNTTIYYGPNIYTRPAARQQKGKYWETLLPVFNLGEAIQRIEVKVQFRVDKYFRVQYKEIESTFKTATEESKNAFADEIRTIDKELKLIFGIKSNQAVFLQKRIRNRNYHRLRDSLLIANKKLTEGPEYDSTKLKAEYSKSQLNKIDSLIKKRADALKDYQSNYILIANRGKAVYEVSEQIKRELITHISDTNYTGPSVRKSDIKISENFKTATILYRNYNYGLRRMPALDPGERMGIFRVRYVPFPVTGTPDDPQMRLLVPFQEGSPAVFEIGLAFGGDIVASDKHVNPVLSWSRLGVAFAITEKLFKDDAKVLALALTYDFNSYGSLGFGVNLAQGQSLPYASFGVNKKAFEEVVKGLASIF